MSDIVIDKTVAAYKQSRSLSNKKIHCCKTPVLQVVLARGLPFCANVRCQRDSVGGI